MISISESLGPVVKVLNFELLTVVGSNSSPLLSKWGSKTSWGNQQVLESKMPKHLLIRIWLAWWITTHFFSERRSVSQHWEHYSLIVVATRNLYVHFIWRTRPPYGPNKWKWRCTYARTCMRSSWLVHAVTHSQTELGRLLLKTLVRKPITS